MSFGSGEVAHAPTAAAAAASRPPAQPRPAAAPAPTPAAGALAGFDELIAASARPSLMDADFFGALAAPPAAARVNPDPATNPAPASPGDAASAVRPRSLAGTFEGSAAPGSPGFGESAFPAPAAAQSHTAANRAAPAAHAGDPFGTPTSLMLLEGTPYSGVGASPPPPQPAANAGRSGRALLAVDLSGSPAPGAGARPPLAQPAVKRSGRGALQGLGQGSKQGAPAKAAGALGLQPGSETGLESPARAWSGPAPGHGEPRPGRGGQDALDELFWAAVEGLHVPRATATGLAARKSGSVRSRPLLARPHPLFFDKLPLMAVSRGTGATERQMLHGSFARYEVHAECGWLPGPDKAFHVWPSMCVLSFAHLLRPPCPPSCAGAEGCTEVPQERGALRACSGSWNCGLVRQLHRLLLIGPASIRV